MKIICIGGGPAGLYAGVLLKLADPRHEITVYEREPAGAGRGWGVTFWDDLLDLMRAHDAESADGIAQVAARWDGLEVDVRGRPRVVQPEFWGNSIARASLVQVMTDRALGLGVRISRGREVSADDVAPEADLVLSADGVGSRFRQAHAAELGNRIDVGRNRFVWLSTPKVFPAFRFAFDEHRAGWLCCYAYAYSPTASTFVVELPPETYQRLELAGLTSAAAMARLQDVFAWQLDGHPLEVQPKDDGSVPWTRFPTVSNRRWHVGNVALLGDAAHTTHYSIGFGTKLALEDAITLSRAVAEEADVPAALRRYETERRRAIRGAQRNARYSARWFERVPRYLPFDSDTFAALLNRRRSPVLAHLPPGLVAGARRVVKGSGLLRRTRAIVRPGAH